NFNITGINVRLEDLNLRSSDDELHFRVLARHLNLGCIFHPRLNAAFEGIDSLVSGKRNVAVKDLPLLRVETHACVVIFLRSEEHTSELQSRFDLVCRLL